MNVIQLDIIMYMRARLHFSDEQWAEVFGDTAGLAFQQDLLNRARVVASHSVPSPKVALSHGALCINCGIFHKPWGNPHGIDILTSCFKCDGYMESHWELTLLGRVMFYE